MGGVAGEGVAGPAVRGEGEEGGGGGGLGGRVAAGLAEVAGAEDEAVVDDQGVAAGAQLDGVAAGGGGHEEAAVARVEGEGGVALAVGAFEFQREGGVEGGGWRGGGGEGVAGADGAHECEGRVGDAAGHRVGEVDGRDDHHAEPGLGHERELGGEAVDRAAVAEPALAEALLHREAEPEAGGRAGIGELGLPHGFEGLGGEEAAVAALQRAAPEHDLDEAREVEDGRVHAAGGRHPEFEGGRVVVGAVDAPHVGVGEVVDDVGFGRERAVAHADGRQHRALSRSRRRVRPG